MTTPPRLDGAPGHRWQPRANGRFACLWIARRDIVKAGYRPETQRIWPPSNTPEAEFDDAAKLYIQSECQRLQDDMHAFNRGQNEKGVPLFDGTVDGLIASYQTDPDSDYQKIRFRSRLTYGRNLKQISRTVGDRQLAKVTGRDLKRWFENWSADGAHNPRAHARMTMLKLIVTFGVTILEDPQCVRLSVILSKLEFTQGRPRDSVLDAGHVNGIRAEAHRAGYPSMALSEAFKFDLMIRRKDVIGEWLPQAEPGLSVVIHRGEKWLYGIDFNEIDASLILKHRLSKSLRGKNAVMDQRAGKLKEFNLKLYPMVMEELALMAGVPLGELRRDLLPASGPLVRNEATTRPYRDEAYRERWRKFATVAGVPVSVQSRDSRAGGITEALDATGGNLNAARHAAGHAQITTTTRYSREETKATAQVAEFRAAKRLTYSLTNKR